MTMKPTISPTTGRSITRVSGHAHRPHQATRYPAAHGRSPLEQRVSDESLRSSVVDAFRRIAHGVDPATAEAQTRAFYRSSGHEWARALTEQGVQVKARVREAFRTMLRGIQDASAHASTIRFYRSGARDWALKL